MVFVISLFSCLIVKGQKMEYVNFYGNLLEKCCIDSQSGDTVRSTAWNQVNSIKHKYLLNYKMVRRNSLFTIEFSYHFGTGEPFTVSKGDSVWIKFIDGYRLALYASDNVSSHKGMAKIPGDLDGSVTPGVSVKYNLSAKQFEHFSDNQVEKVRIFNNSGNADIPWPGKKRTLPVQAAKQMIEKRTSYPACVPDPVNGNTSNTDEF